MLALCTANLPLGPSTSQSDHCHQENIERRAGQHFAPLGDRICSDPILLKHFLYDLKMSYLNPQWRTDSYLSILVICYLHFLYTLSIANCKRCVCILFSFKTWPMTMPQRPRWAKRERNFNAFTHSSRLSLIVLLMQFFSTYLECNCFHVRVYFLFSFSDCFFLQS